MKTLSVELKYVVPSRLTARNTNKKIRNRAEFCPCVLNGPVCLTQRNAGDERKSNKRPITVLRNQSFSVGEFVNGVFIQSSTNDCVSLRERFCVINTTLRIKYILPSSDK